MNTAATESRPPPPALLPIERALLLFYQQMDVCVFNRRQRACLRTIRRRSFDLGFGQTEELDLSFFVEDNASSKCGFQMADASRGIDDLVAMRIIMAPNRSAAKQANGKNAKRPKGRYGINVLWGTWLCERRTDSGRLEQRILELERDGLDAELRKCYIEFGGFSPNASQEMGAVPPLRSGPLGPGGDCNTPRIPEGGRATVPLTGSDAGRTGESKSPPYIVDAVNRSKQSPTTEPRAVEDLVLKTTSGDSDAAQDLVVKTRRGDSDATQDLVLKTTRAARTAKDGPESGVVLKTRHQTSAAERGEERFPPHTPLSKTLNVERLTVNRSALNAQAKLTKDREKELIERLTDWLGAQEMVGDGKPGQGYGGMWRSKWVRNYPDDVDSEMRWGQQLEAQNHPDRPQHRAKWLTWRLKVIAGARSVDEIQPGLAPTA